MEQISVLSILRTGDQYVFQIEAREEGRGASRTVAPWTLDEAKRRTLQDEVAATAQLLNDLLQTSGPLTPESNDEIPDPWFSLGRRLYAQLLPPTIKTFLQQISPHSPLILATNDPTLPWEFLHDGDRYLALTHPMGRQLLLNSLPRQKGLWSGKRLAALLVGNPSGDLSEADAEVQALIQRIEVLPDARRPRALLRQRATKEAVLRELASSEYTLIHYAGHAQVNLEEEESGALILAGGERLTADEIAQHLSGQPLIFLNACASAQETVELADDLVHLRGAQGLAAGFVRGGAQGVIGTFWPVHDVGSRQLAEAFYQHILQGTPVGEALRQARLQTREARPSDPIWAAFLLCGDPRDRLLASDRWARQPTTILCAQITDLSSVLSALSTEAAAELLDAWSELVTAEIERYGGVVHSVTQETVLGAFSVVPGLAHDAERAIRAALAVEKKLSQLRHPSRLKDQPLSAAMGVHTGEVMIRPSASVTRGQLTIAGNTVEHARWLASQAEPGQILTSTDTTRPVRDQFAVVPHTVETEVSQPTATFRVLGPARVVSYATPFLGREDEIATLQACWEQAARGRGQLIGVVGEAGIGKSRLLRAFQDQLENKDTPSTNSEEAPRRHLWIEARCPRTRPDAPFGALAALIRVWFSIPSDTDPISIPGKIEAALQRMEYGEEQFDGMAPPEVASILSDILGVEAGDIAVEQIEPRVRHGLLVRVFKEVLGRSAYQQPVILVLDDMHCVDPASLEIIDRLVEGIERLPVLCILAYRPEWAHGWVNRPNYHQITLDRLNDQTSKALLDVLLGAGSPVPELSDAMLARSGGNPFFLEELVRSLRAQGVIVPAADGGWQMIGTTEEMELPSTIQRAIAGRIDRLNPGAKTLLQSAAVVGSPFKAPVLGDVVAISDARAALDDHLAELIRSDFIFERWPESEFEFHHPLVQEVAYAGLSDTQRQRFHHRAGESLEKAWPKPTGEQTEVLAHHFYRSIAVLDATGAVIDEAEPTQMRQAIDYLAQAGGWANRHYAARSAITHYRRALMLAGQLSTDVGARRVECYEGLGDGHNLLGDFKKAIQAYRTAFAELTAEITGPDERRWAADLARRIGRLYGWQARHDEAIHWMKQGLDVLGDKLDESSRATAAMIHIHTGTVYYFRGQYDSAVARIQRGLGIVEGTDHETPMAHGHNVLGAVHDARGERKQAVDHYEKSLSLWEKIGNDYQKARVQDNLGVVYFHLGRWGAAAESHRRALDFFDKVEDRDQMIYPCLNLGNVHLCRGAWDQAEDLFERGRALSKAVGNQRMLALAHINRGLVALEREDWTTARRRLEHGLNLLEQHGIEDFLAEVQAAMGRLCLGEGDATAALAWGRKALDAAQTLEMQLEAGLAHRVLGLAYRAQGDLTQAEEHLKRSLAVLESVEHRHEIGRTLVQLARVCEDENRLEEARAQMNCAISVFQELGAQSDLRRAQHLFNEWDSGDVP